LPGVPASPARPVLSPQDRRTRNLSAALSRKRLLKFHIYLYSDRGRGKHLRLPSYP
jgi:hypothetical protein